ncbi:DUF4145 domain-containing protein [Frankia sp. Cpl3]|nr:DUF4145 domain-containing protein [Frankia sp. Cpl3]
MATREIKIKKCALRSHKIFRGVDVSVLEFCASLVSSLAWPMAVVGIFIILRVPLTRILGRLSALRFGDFEFDFQQQISDIEQAAREAEEGGGKDSPSSSGPSTVGNLATEVAAVAEVSPRAAIPLAWSAVEQALFEATERIGIVFGRSRVTALDAINALKFNEHIGASTAEALNRLRVLRNEVIHASKSASDLGQSDAEEYANLAQRMIAILARIDSAARMD